MVYGIFNVCTDVNACDCTRGCTDTVRESALKVDSWRKIPCRTGESNLRRQRAGPTLYQPSYIPNPSNVLSTAEGHITTNHTSKFFQIPVPRTSRRITSFGHNTDNSKKKKEKRKKENQIRTADNEQISVLALHILTADRSIFKQVLYKHCIPLAQPEKFR